MVSTTHARAVVEVQDVSTNIHSLRPAILVVDTRHSLDAHVLVVSGKNMRPDGWIIGLNGTATATTRTATPHDVESVLRPVHYFEYLLNLTCVGYICSFYQQKHRPYIFIITSDCVGNKFLTNRPSRNLRSSTIVCCARARSALAFAWDENYTEFSRLHCRLCSRGSNSTVCTKFLQCYNRSGIILWYEWFFIGKHATFGLGSIYCWLELTHEPVGFVCMIAGRREAYHRSVAPANAYSRGENINFSN